MDSLKSGLSSMVDGGSNEQTMFEQGCGLTRKQRIIGFIACVGLGCVISFFSFFLWSKPTSFALLYTFGNIISLLGTGFLVGFKTQLKQAFAAKRVVATVVFLASMILTILAAVLWKSVPLAVIMIIIQSLALIWYSLSYIPFARDAVISCLKGICVRG